MLFAFVVSPFFSRSLSVFLRCDLFFVYANTISQIIFDGYGKLTGAQIKTFLLEKVRVVKHSAMERNYHIFYMLAAGASAEQREGWAMGDLEDHQFTSQSGCYDRRDGVLDSDLYTELIEAFSVMGFEEKEKASGVRGVGSGEVGGAGIEACGCIWGFLFWVFFWASGLYPSWLMVAVSQGERLVMIGTWAFIVVELDDSVSGDLCCGSRSRQGRHGRQRKTRPPSAGFPVLPCRKGVFFCQTQVENIFLLVLASPREAPPIPPRERPPCAMAGAVRPPSVMSNLCPLLSPCTGV